MEIKTKQKMYKIGFYGLNGVECSKDLVSDCTTYNEEKEVYELNEGVTIEDIINYLKEEVDKSENEEYYVEVYINNELIERHYGDGENFIFNEDEKDIIKDDESYDLKSGYWNIHGDTF